MHSSYIPPRSSGALRRRLLGPVLIGTLLLLTGGNRSAAPSGGTPQGGSIHPALLGRVSSGDPDSLYIWVHLRDRGLNRVGLRRALDEASQYLSARALDRRRRRGRITGVVGSDLPVSASYVEMLRRTGLRVRCRSRWLNAVSGVVAPSDLTRLAGHSFVLRVTPLGRGRRIEPAGRLARPQPSPPTDPAGFHRRGQEPGPEFYGISYAQNLSLQVPALHAEHLTGAGIVVGICDTGFRLTHRAVSGLTVLDQYDFVNDDPVVANQPGDPADSDDHGTSVWSTVAGYWPGMLVGPAYEATFLLAKTEDVGSETPVEEDYWIAAVEWMEGKGVDVINTSLGYYDWYSYRDIDGDTAPITVAADAAVARGVVVVTSAGNEDIGLPPPDPDYMPIHYYIGAPADGDSVIAVGATNDAGRRASFSSHGPTFDGRTKPDVMALGVGVACAQPAWGDSGLTLYGSGTSFSSPLVAGVVALVLEAHPDWGPVQIREALRATADRSHNNVAGEPDNDYGWGYVQGADAKDYGEVPQDSAEIVRFFNYPNPFPTPSSPTTTFHCVVTEVSKGRILIYTQAGTLVRVLSVEAKSDTTVEAVWNGLNESGRLVAPAVYLAVIELGGNRAYTRVLRIP